MARTAKRPSRQKGSQFDAALHRRAEAVGAWVTQNPTLVGGTTAFLIAMSFVSANAIWYQPHAHTAPFFVTRSFETFAPADQSATVEEQTTFRLERPEAPLPSAKPKPALAVAADPAVQRVQAILKDLGYYKGSVDGISGPNTSAAISAYQRKMGLDATGRIDQKLLSELGAGDITGSIEPVAEVPPTATDKLQPEAVSLSRIQEGLRAFGNSGVKIDGKMGKKTRDGIMEFQALFGLQETGEPNKEVFNKMLAEGLIQ